MGDRWFLRISGLAAIAVIRFGTVVSASSIIAVIVASVVVVVLRPVKQCLNSV
jgi:hypothetical protein